MSEKMLSDHALPCNSMRTHNAGGFGLEPCAFYNKSTMKEEGNWKKPARPVSVSAQVASSYLFVMPLLSYQ